MICDHHHCTSSCLYGGKNQLVVAQFGDQANPDKLYEGYLCCKCHNLTLVPQGDPAPAEMTDECRERWQAYDAAIDEYIESHGPLGG